MSTERTGRPSRCAAMPRMAASAVTPCPPTPASRMFQAPSSPGSGSVGSGSSPPPARARGFGLRGLGALQGDEGGAEAVHAGKVLVAGALVDAALAAEGGLDRLDGEAVRGAGAVAAILADAGVDDGAARRLGGEVALALAAALGGAFLVVDQDRDAGRLAELALHRIQFGAVVVGDALRHAAGRRGGGRGRRRRGRCRPRPRRPSARRSAGTPISPSGVWPPVMATAPLTRILKVMVALAATAARTARLPEWV